MSATAKPPAEDPLTGKPVVIKDGKLQGQRGVVRRCFRGRVATPDCAFIELQGGLPGWYVSVPVDQIEVTG